MSGAEVFIPTTRGVVAVVDFDEYHKVRGRKWYAAFNRHGKLTRIATKVPAPERGKLKNGFTKQRTVLMHRILMGLDSFDAKPEGLSHRYVDHADGNPANNRRSNLRKCFHADNQKNRGAQRNSTSNYRGVSWHKNAGKWRAMAFYKGKQHHIGLYTNEIEAARAVDSWWSENLPAEDLPFHKFNNPAKEAA